MVPEEAWSGNKPSINHFNIFGSLCYRHVPDQRRKKMDDKSENMIFVGYNATGSYKVYIPKNEEVTFNEDVYFDEACSWEEFQPTSKAGSNMQIEREYTYSRLEEHHETTNNDTPRVIGLPIRTRQAPSRLGDYQIYYDGNITAGDLVQHMALMEDMKHISFE